MASTRHTHAPGLIGGRSPQFAVDEIADAPEEQADRHQRGDEIGHLQKVVV